MRNVFAGFVIAAGIMATAPMLAQNAAKPAQIFINNAPASVNLDVFLNAGKVQSVPVTAQGTAAFSLDLLNLGKPTGQLYVEVCKDGQRIRVISDGMTVPEDEGCNRKPIGAAFTFTCTNKITLNWAQAKASFSGCGSLLTNKTFLIPVGAAVGSIPFWAGGGNDVTTFGGGTTAQNISANVVNVQTPAAPAPAPQVPAPPPPPAALDLNGTYDVGVCTVVFDPASHEAVLRLCSLVRQILASASNGGVTFRADAPWVTIGGSYNTTTGEFSLSTTGVVAGFNNVSVTLRGNVTSSGQFVGELEYGGNGTLPGAQPVRYQIRAQRR